MFMTYLATILRASATFVWLGGLLHFAPAGIRRILKSAMCGQTYIGGGPRDAGVVAKAIARGRGAIGWLASAHHSKVEKANRGAMRFLEQ